MTWQASETSKQRLKEEEIELLRDQIKEKEEISKVDVEGKEEVWIEEPKAAAEIKETVVLELEKHREIPTQPIIEIPEGLIKEPEKPETRVEKEEVVRKPSKPKEKPKLQEPKKEKFKAGLRKPVIEDVKIVKIRDMWRKKPAAFSSESDAIIITIKTPEGKKEKKTFYAYIEPGGMLGIKYGRAKTPTQQKFINFLRYYKLADNLEEYDVIEESKGWKGKTVKIDSSGKIVIPEVI
ncbi:MAG: hypothetical protein HY051_00315 [Candidatus Aenigmarchaeota archaeon]|nr:hypothetical protein [Candidatus Aenigmarchaeota archaeon]